MDFIDKKDVPPTVKGPGRVSKWTTAMLAIEAGKVVVLRAAEVAEYSEEASLRATFYENAKRRGFKVITRKDPATGDLYVFKKEDGQ